MAYIPKQDGVVSSVNSTTVPLGAGASFTGTPEEVFSYSTVNILVFADQPGTLLAEFSVDGINWDSVRTIPTLASKSQTHSLATVARYFRVVHVNGGTPQTIFRLQTTYHRERSKLLTDNIDASIDSASDVSLVRAVLVGQALGGGFQNIDIDAEGHLEIGIFRPTTPFGEVAVAEATPVIQLDAVYGILSTDLETFTSGTGSVDGDTDSLFKCNTGLGVGGYGVIRSKRDARYRAGQGLTFRFTASYTAGIANSQQAAGPFTSENALQFGFNGTQFGILRRTGGALEIQQLTITNPAAGAETAVITLDGVVYNIPITAGTAAHNCWQIATSANFGPAQDWQAFQVDNTVIFTANAPGNKAGAFSFSSAGAATGTFLELRAGATPNDFWTYQPDWNIDPLDGNGPSGMTLDPTRLNVYQITMQWLGAGQLLFEVEDPEEGQFTRVHRVKYANANVVPSIENPSMKLGWFAASLGSSGTDLQVAGASASATIEGKVQPFRGSFAQTNVKSGIGATPQAVITLKNSTVFRNRVNFKEIFPLAVTIGTDGSGAGSAPVSLLVYRNATLPGSGGAADEPNYQYVDINDSCALVEKSAETISGGTLVAVASLAKTGQQTVSLEDLEIVLNTGETLTFAVTTSAGSVAATIGIMWYED